MNIEQALAEALDECTTFPDGDEPADMKERYAKEAAAILATPQMQAIARQAAIGAAVERLPQGWLLGQFDDGDWGVFSADMTEVKAYGLTPDAAIAAALGEDE